jgi:hypothetical protein
MRAACAASLLAIPAASAEVVYDSLAPINPNSWAYRLSLDPGESSSADELGGENHSQVGFVVNLGGTSRRVSLLEMRSVSYWLTGSVPPQVSFATTVRFYTVVNGLPAALLWEGTSNVVSYTHTTMLRYTQQSFMPDIWVPGSFAVAVSYSQVVSPRADVGTSFQYGTQGVGSAGDLLLQDSTTGHWTAAYQGEQTFQMRITAVPAPASATLLGLALLAGAHRRRPAR